MDYYKILEVSENADILKIKKQKRKMIRKILKINILKIILVLEKNFLKVRPK